MMRAMLLVTAVVEPESNLAKPRPQVRRLWSSPQLVRRVWIHFASNFGRCSQRVADDVELQMPALMELVREAVDGAVGGAAGKAVKQLVRTLDPFVSKFGG